MITNNYPLNKTTTSFGEFLFLENYEEVFQKCYQGGNSFREKREMAELAEAIKKLERKD